MILVLPSEAILSKFVLPSIQKSSNYMYIRLLDIVPKTTEGLFTLFLSMTFIYPLTYSLDSFYT